MPKYSRNEELGNTISHALGAIMSLIGMISIIVKSINLNNIIYIICSTIYGLSLFVLYTSSAVYHGIKEPDKKAKAQKLDHLSINILIFGSNVIFICASLESRLGYVLGGVEAALAIISIVLNIIDVKRFRAISMIIYIVSGWFCIIVIKYIYVAIGFTGAMFLALGGIIYTMGLIFYGMKKPWAHFVWHIFVLIGSILHFIAAYSYVIC